MNFWKQSNHVMSYFKGENFRGDKRLPSNFMTGFLEVRSGKSALDLLGIANECFTGSQLVSICNDCLCIYLIEGSPQNALMSIMLLCEIQKVTLTNPLVGVFFLSQLSFPCGLLSRMIHLMLIAQYHYLGCRLVA